jgi:hypothetical protein
MLKNVSKKKAEVAIGFLAVDEDGSIEKLRNNFFT